MSTRLSWAEIAKRPGFYEFADHKNCFTLITANGKSHYGDQKRITHPDFAHNKGDYFFKPSVPIPKDYDFSMVPKEDLAGITRGSKLLLLEKKPWKS